jgi:hypothetical protein
VLVPVPDSTMVWYYAGQKLVYVHPTAAIKLAFDVRRLTGYGTHEREADLIAAYSGDRRRLDELVSKYGAAYMVLRRDGERVGAVDLPAAGLRGPRRDGKLVSTNHYEWLTLGRDDPVRFEIVSPADGEATVTLRARRRTQSPRISGHLYVNGFDFPVGEAETDRDRYAEVARVVPLRAGSNEVQFLAGADFELARFVAYTTPLAAYLDRYRVAYEDGHTVVLAPR